jgi:hypothetical protein
VNTGLILRPGNSQLDYQMQARVDMPERPDYVHCIENRSTKNSWCEDPSYVGPRFADASDALEALEPESPLLPCSRCLDAIFGRLVQITPQAPADLTEELVGSLREDAPVYRDAGVRREMWLIKEAFARGKARGIWEAKNNA